jgi:hypothetical protein
MADFYVCKYACKYSSELVYAFGLLKDLISRRNLKVLSFGCGPCTDLLALDYLRGNDAYCYEFLDYRGVDYGEYVWQDIHDDIKSICPDEVHVRFSYKNAKTFITRMTSCSWVPDLIVFQYFFSDMHKSAGAREVNAFINEFAKYANSRMHLNSYIVLNDINLSTQYGGGREYFDKLFNALSRGLHDKGHFHNNTRKNTYGYGRELEKNSLFFGTSNLKIYNPFTSCSSAQMIYQKGGKET